MAGAAAHAGARPAASADGARALVVQTSFLGDMVLTTPLIAELARRGPVDVVATPASAPLLANNPAVRRVIVYDKRGTDAGVRGLWRMAREVRASSSVEGEHVGTTAYLAQGSMRTALLALLAGATERVGFATSAGRALYTRRVEYHEQAHHAERLWRLAAVVNAPSPPAGVLRPRLYPGAAEIAAVDGLLASSGHAGEPLVVLAPGSVWPTKRWPGYVSLARRLSARARVVVVGGPADAELATEVATAAGGSAINATGRLSLLASAELIGRAVAMVTNDSAPLHLASAMGIPTVAVFGPTVPEFGFGPLAPARRVIGHESLACRPCDRHGPRQCPLGHWRCMREIDVRVVEEAVRQVTSNPSE